MRLHTNHLTASDAFGAVFGTLARYYYGGNLPTDLTIGTGLLKMSGVRVDVMAHGSRSHTRSLEVKLTGTSGRRPNPGTGGRYPTDDHAATWDEWGMFLTRLYDADPAMVCGSVSRPIYAGAEHFNWATGNRYNDLTPEDQHRWEHAGSAATGRYSVSECKCGAIRRHGSASYVTENFGPTVVR